MKLARGLFLFVILFSVLFAATSEVSAAFKYLSEGMEAPEVEGKDVLTGEKVSSKTKSAEGESVIVVAFWATWSHRSIELLEDLAAYVRELNDPRLRVIAVNVEGQRVEAHQLQAIRNRIAELDLPFPVVLDEGLELFSTYGVVAVPSTAVLDEESTLRYGPAGYSYLIRDRVIDSIETYLGIRQQSEFAEVPRYVPQNEASRYYNLARQMSLRGMTERALVHLEHAAAADSAFAAVPVLRGEVLLSVGRTEAALESFAQATRLDPGSAPAWAGLGQAQRVLGNHEAAEQSLGRALELAPAYTPALIELARVKEAEGDHDAAEALLEQARELLGSDPTLDFDLGRIREARGDVAGALNSYRMALESLFPLDWNPRRR